MNPAIYFLSTAKINKTYVPTPIVIGEQIWDQKNLDTAYYSDGTPIPNNTLTTGTNRWAITTFGAWRYLSDSLTNGAIYGKLYNHFAVAGIWDTASSSNPLLRKSLAPDGWRVATDADWTALEAYSQTTPTMLTGTNKLRENASQGHWTVSSTNPGTNTSLFTALGGGYISYLSASINIFTYGYWRTQDASIVRRLSYASNVSTNAAATSMNNAGFSVRLIKNNIIPTDFTTTFISKTTTQISVSGSFGPNFTYTNFTEKGIVYGTGPNPTRTSNSYITALPNTVTNYNVDIPGLTAGLLYYIRAYFISGGLKYYATELQITTGTGNPTVSTTAYTNLSYTTVTSGGTITDDGGSTILERGVCWSASTTSPLITDSHTSDGTGTGLFTSSITGLIPGTKYYYRAYARNAITTSYGAANVSFTTISQSIILTTVPIGSNYTNITITSGGNITDVNETIVTDKGICWNTTGSPTIANSIKSAGPGYDIGVPFSLTADGLSPGVQYFIRAYATNTSTYYGDEVSVTTSIPNVSITTATPSNVNAVSFYCGATAITNPNGYTIQVGYCWGTSADPVKGIGNFVNNSTATVPFAIPNGTTLEPSTTYWVRAYIITTTQAGYIKYGLSTSTQTLNATPTVTTNGVTAFTAQSITAGGSVTLTKGVTVLDKGLCYALAPTTPTVSTGKVSAGAGEGTFSNLLIPGLTYGKNYNILAYSTNAYGALTYYATNTISQTTYTPNILITTGTVSFYDALNVTCSATSITPDPPYSIDETGYCWGTTNTPEKGASNFVKNPTATTFTSLASGALLTPNTQYFIRAYAINNATGYIAYGLATSAFTTLTATPTFALPTSSNVTANAMTISSNVTATNGVPISARGVVWNTSTAPTIANSKTSDGTSSGTILSSLTSLSGNVQYFIRAYVTTAYGTYYSNEVIQTTLTPNMSMSTSAVTNVLALSATSGGNTISQDSLYPITERGFCWGNSQDTPFPFVGTGNFAKAATLTGITPFSMDSLSSGNEMTPLSGYYIRAYIYTASANYYAYGNSVGPFTTLTATPSFTTNPASAVTPISITSGGTITQTNGVPITQKGICWSNTTATPTILNSSFTTLGSGSANFTSTTTGVLTYNSTYNIRAYITHIYGGSTYTYYSTNTVTQSTLTPAFSIVTGTVTILKPLSVTIAATVSQTETTVACQITSRGICWGTSVNPTKGSNNYAEPSGLTTFSGVSSDVSGYKLTPGTTYYFRAYATNSTTGYTAYGLDSSSIIIPLDNAVATIVSPATNVTTTSFDVSYTISASTYYPTIIESGVVYGATNPPTTGNGTSISGTGGTVSITGLSPNTTYFVRSFIKNDVKTTYSSVVQQATLFATTLKNAYALRRIVPGYTGPCILLRNAAGATTTIGFVGNELNAPIDRDAIEVWTGTTATSQGTINTWYDQSGTNNLNIYVPNSRPCWILRNGVYQTRTIGGVTRPCIRFIQGSGAIMLSTTGSWQVNNLSIFMVTSTIGYGITQYGLLMSNMIMPFPNTSTANTDRLKYGATTSIIATGQTDVPKLDSTLSTTTGITVWRNNTLVNTFAGTDTAVDTQLYFGSNFGTGGNQYNGTIQELRIYAGNVDSSTAITTTRETISTTIKDYYGITP